MSTYERFGAHKDYRSLRAAQKAHSSLIDAGFTDASLVTDYMDGKPIYRIMWTVLTDLEPPIEPRGMFGLRAGAIFPRREGRTRNPGPGSPIPGLNKWSTYYGGTVLGGKKSGYGLTVETASGIYRFAIDPEPNAYGRFVTYQLWARNHPGGVNWLISNSRDPKLLPGRAEEFIRQRERIGGTERRGNPTGDVETMTGTPKGYNWELVIEIYPVNPSRVGGAYHYEVKSYDAAVNKAKYLLSDPYQFPQFSQIDNRAFELAVYNKSRLSGYATFEKPFSNAANIRFRKQRRSTYS